MNRYIANPIITRLDGFNEDGLHCGWAQWPGETFVWMCHTGADSAMVRNKQEAENWLRAKGAVEIKESDGFK